MEEKLIFPDREHFREWLFKNHGVDRGFWMVFGKGNKAKTLKPDEALEEALCFGWIDGLIKSVDEEKYLKKFSPRKKGSNWSRRNKEIVDSLIKNGKMTLHGVKAIEEAKKSGTWDKPERAPVTEEQVNILIKDINGTKPALSNYLNMTSRTQKLYAGYYLATKKEDVRINRLRKIIEQLNRNNKSPMF